MNRTKFTPENLRETAANLLDMRPDPVPRFRILRDVLRLDAADSALRDAEAALECSKWIRLLESSQHDDGTWGRFHTQDTGIKQPFPTTESAVSIAVSLGLTVRHPVLTRVIPYILDCMSGASVWPDPPEKHDNPLAWWIWLRHYSAAMLALIEPRHPALDPFWSIRAKTVEAAFASGEYDRGVEIQMLNELLDCRMKNPVPFHVKPSLLVLSATDNRLPESVELSMLSFIMKHPRGMYYVYDRQIGDFPEISSRGFWGWLRAHDLLSRFRSWKRISADAMNWVWDQRTREGFWDFGPGIARKPFTCFPLSESWRTPGSRLIDSSTVVLALLSKRFDGS
jgi:hypothetical protein